MNGQNGGDVTGLEIGVMVVMLCVAAGLIWAIAKCHGYC